jgi:hypothetical protein
MPGDTPQITPDFASPEGDGGELSALDEIFRATQLRRRPDAGLEATRVAERGIGRDRQAPSRQIRRVVPILRLVARAHRAAACSGTRRDARPGANPRSGGQHRRGRQQSR